MVSKLSGRFQNWYFWMAYKSSRRLNISRWPHPFQSASGHFQILSKHLSQSQSYSNISIWFHMIKLLGYFPMISNFQAGRFHNFQDGSSLFQNFPIISKVCQICQKYMQNKSLMKNMCFLLAQEKWLSREQQLRPFWACRFVRKGFARGKLLPGKYWDFVPLIQTPQNTNRHYLTLQCWE